MDVSHVCQVIAEWCEHAQGFANEGLIVKLCVINNMAAFKGVAENGILRVMRNGFGRRYQNAKDKMVSIK